MAYSAPSTVSTGDLCTAAIWNQDVVANPIAIYAGAMSVTSQAVGDILYASSTTQLGRIAAVATGQVLTSAGTGTVPAWSSNVDLGGTLDVTGATTLDSTLTVVNDVAVDTDTLFVDVSEDKVYIGHTASVGTGPALQIASTSGAGASLCVSRWSNDAGCGNLLMMKSRAATVGGSAVIVADGDPIGAIQWQADDGTDQATSCASITVNVDGTPGSNDMPARMSFATAADGAASPTARMTILSSGFVGIGTAVPNRPLSVCNGQAKTYTTITYPVNLVQTNESSNYSQLGVYFTGAASQDDRITHFQPSEAGVSNQGIIEMNPDGGKFRAKQGILFGTDTAAANELDDYEEGTWTGTAVSVGGTSLQVLLEGYVKIGKIVHIYGALDANVLNTTGGSSYVSGLPFTVGTDGGTGAAMKGDRTQGGAINFTPSTTLVYLTTFSNISGQIRFLGSYTI